MTRRTSTMRELAELKVLDKTYSTIDQLAALDIHAYLADCRDGTINIEEHEQILELEDHPRHTEGQNVEKFLLNWMSLHGPFH